MTNDKFQWTNIPPTHVDRLDNLNADDLDAIRAKRLQEMKKRQEKMIEWKRNVSN